MADEWRVGRHPVCAWTCLTFFAFVRPRQRHTLVAPAEEPTREAYQEMIDSASALHAFHRRSACTPSACPRREGMGGIKGIRDVKGLILLAKTLSASSCSYTA